MRRSSGAEMVCAARFAETMKATLVRRAPCGAKRMATINATTRMRVSERKRDLQPDLALACAHVRRDASAIHGETCFESGDSVGLDAEAHELRRRRLRVEQRLNLVALAAARGAHSCAVMHAERAWQSSRGPHAFEVQRPRSTL